MLTTFYAFYQLFFLIIYPIFGLKVNENLEDNYEWKITFEDNFDFFDNSKWRNMNDIDGRTIWSNKELQWYLDENVVCENGILKLIAKKERVYGKDPESEKYFDYTSGMICNSRSFLQAYGKWEMKCKFPFKKGFWPAFFLVPKQRPTLPEIDVFEYFGINKDKISCNHHWGVDYPNAGTIYSGHTGPFYSAEGKELTGEFNDVWMIWSFECFPEKMVWKLDGVTVYEANKGIPSAPLYMIANVAIKDFEKNNYEVDITGLPYIMEIDYVRIYQMVPKQ